MRCLRIKEIISAFIDSEASSLERLAMQEHVKDCPSCKKELSDQYTLKSMVKSARVAEPTVDFSASIMGRIGSQTPEAAVPPKSRSRYTVAAMALVVFCVAVISLRFGTDTTPTMNSERLAGNTATDTSVEYAEYIYQHLSDDLAYAGNFNYQR